MLLQIRRGQRYVWMDIFQDINVSILVLLLFLFLKNNVKEGVHGVNSKFTVNVNLLGHYKVKHTH